MSDNLRDPLREAKEKGWPWFVQEAPAEEDMPGNSNIPYPKISIITTSFNSEIFLEETIRGVLQQKYPNLEYIIIDGGSTDDTISIIKAYSEHISYWISEPDKGENSAINKGFARCSGEIITFNSSDDVYMPGVFHDVAVKYIAEPECGAVIGGFRYIDEKSDVISGEEMPRMPRSAPLDLSTIKGSEWRLHQQATFYTSSGLKKAGRYVREDLKYTGDRELLYRIAKSNRIVLSNMCYASYRIHKGSQTRGEYASRLEADKEYYVLQKSFIKGEDGLDGRREKIARSHLSKIYLNKAKYSSGIIKELCWLIMAAVLNMELVTKRSYWGIWLRKGGLRKEIKTAGKTEGKKSSYSI